MATPSSRGNSNAVGKIVGPKSATMGGGNINRRGEVDRPGDPGGHVWEKAPVKKLNPQGKTMGQIAGEVRSSTLQGAGGVLGGQHAGGHSDVMGAINMGGFTVKTPVIKPTSTKNK